MSKELEARHILIKYKGAVCETKEDRHGETKSGWWLDDTWLAPANDPRQALHEIEGKG